MTRLSERVTRAVARCAMALGAFVLTAPLAEAQQSAVVRHRTVVIDLAGRPVVNARVRIAAGRTFMTDDRGMALLDSVPVGKQQLDITAVGYVPERRTLDVRASDTSIPVDTVILQSLESVLDTARITATGAIGFDARRRGKIGQFITAADIVREDPHNLMALLRTREGMRFQLDPRGIPSIAMDGGPKGRTCRPQVLIDGFPAPPTMSSPGHSALDAAMHLEDIGGVELYLNPATIPPKLSLWATDPRAGLCGAIIFWTRGRLGLPHAPKSLQRP